MPQAANSISFRLVNDFASLEDSAQMAAEFGERFGLERGAVLDLQLVLEEVITNIIRHGYADRDCHEITVRLTHHCDETHIQIEDDGAYFNPTQVAPGDSEDAIEERLAGGIGIRLVRRLTDGMEYKRESDKNVLLLVKRF